MTDRQSSQSESTAEQPLKFTQRLLVSDSKKKAEDAEYQGEQAKHDIEGCLLETRQEISRHKRDIENLKGTAPLDLQAILEKNEELAATERALEILNGLKSELF